MDLTNYEREYEEKHLKCTIETIKEIIDEKNLNIEDYKKSIVERKRFLYEHSTEFYGADLHAEMNDEDLNVHLVNKDIIKVYKLYRSMETPYFSRIDFQEDNGEEDTFYIGLTGVDKKHVPLIYDWRTPIANLYYNYGLGKSSYEGGEGIVSGTTTLKRQFDIKMGKIVNVYDSSIGVSDALLEKVLSDNTSEQMRNIVDTIQSEQNEVIRYPASNTLIVEGVAGSGKTSVALHRIAYLLYNSKNLSNRNVLIFSPSDVFTNYISNVLPELGEENVQTTTFKDFAQNYIKGYEIEELTEFIEKFYEGKSHDSSDIEFKLSSKYRSHLDTIINAYFESLKFTKKIGLKNSIIKSHELNSIKSSVPKKLSFHDKMVYLSEKICSALMISEIDNSNKMTKILYKLLNVETDPVELYKLLTHIEIQEKINYEDIFGILYVYFEIDGYPVLNFIKQVVIDEAQDYSLWQFEMIKAIFKSATFTILGDKNQSINPYLKYNSLEAITEVFKNSKYKRLNNTYRSSREIIEYSNQILGINIANAVRNSNGVNVQKLKEKDLQQDITRVIEDYKKAGYKHIAIIVKNTLEVESLKQFAESSVQVLPVYISKGLEYDAVIIYTKRDNYFKENELNLFYVAATRALHALTVFNQKL